MGGKTGLGFNTGMMHGAGRGRVSFCRCAPGSRSTFVAGDLGGAMSRDASGFVPDSGCRMKAFTDGRCINKLGLGSTSRFSGRRMRTRLTRGFRTHRAMDSKCIQFSRGFTSSVGLVTKLHVRRASLHCANHGCSSRASGAAGANHVAGDCIGFLPSVLIG